MWAFVWGTTTRKWITSTCAAIVGVMTVITSTNAAWPTIEYWSYAYRGYVRWVVDDRVMTESQKIKMSQGEVQQTLRHIQIEQAEGKREATANDLAKWQLELNRAPDAQARDLIAEQVRKLQDTKTKLDHQIETLNRQ